MFKRNQKTAAENQSDQNQGFSKLQLQALATGEEYQPTKQSQPAPEAKQQPKTEKDGGDGCLSQLSCSCSGCGCIFVIFILSIILVFVYLVVEQPPQIIEPARTWLNADLQAVNYEEQSLDTVSIDLERQIRDFNIGENTLVITETQLNNIARSGAVAEDTPEFFIDIQPSIAKIFFDVDDSEKVLWLVAELTIDEAGQLQLTGFGTERLKAPGFVNQLVMESLFSILELQGGADINSLVDVFVQLPDNVSVTSIELLEDEVQINLEVRSGLENFLITN